MPHRCMNCGKTYEDEADELLDGCSCGSSLFLYQKHSDADDEEELPESPDSVMEEIDKFIRDVKNKVNPETNVEFDLQSIKVAEDGVYEINLRKLLEEVPLIVEVKEGKYHIHLASVFSKGKNKGLRLKDLEDMDIDEAMKERLKQAMSDE